MNSGAEQFENLWKYSEYESPRGPLFDAREALSDAFHSVKDLPELPEIVQADGDGYITDSIDGTAPTSPYTTLESNSKKRKLNFNLKARQTATNSLFIGIQQAPVKKGEIVDDTIHQYIINPDGTLVRIDELETAYSPKITDDEIEFVIGSVNAITRNLTGAVEAKRREIALQQEMAFHVKSERRSRIRRRVAGTAITMGVISGLTAGGWWLWNENIHKPGVAEDLRRETFDSSNYDIEGTPIELDSQQFVILPQNEFEAIPAFRENDTLEHPRIFTLDSDACAVIPMSSQALDGQAVISAVPEYNPIGKLSMTAYESGDTLKVCVTDEDDDTTATGERIAVQLVESQNR